MAFSEFLHSRRAAARALVSQLRTKFDYVSVLGVDVKAKSIRADRNTTNISTGRDTECGFVVKVTGNGIFFEYSLDDIGEEPVALADKIAAAFRLNAALRDNTVGCPCLSDEPLAQSFARDTDLADYSEQQILTFAKDLCQQLLDKSACVLNAVVGISSLEVSKLFVSENRELDQNYAWVNGMMAAVYRENDKVVQVHEGSAFHLMG